MVRLSNDSQNLALRGTSNAKSNLAQQRAHNSQRSSAMAARSRVNSVRFANQAEEKASGGSNLLARVETETITPQNQLAQLGRIEDAIEEHLELSKSMKKFYQDKISLLTTQGENSSDYERAMLDGYRKELSLYQSAEDFWLLERTTNYQYSDADLDSVETFYEEIKALQTTFDETGVTQNKMSKKIRELYNLKQGENPFGIDSEVNPADKQADMLKRITASNIAAADAGSQVDKWLAYSIENPNASTAGLENARNQESFSETSKDIWKNRFNFWNELAEQTHFIKNQDRLEQINALSVKISEAEAVLADWLGATEDINQARTKAAETLGIIGDLEVEIRKLFL